MYKQIRIMRVKKIIENSNKINHPELRSDIESGAIVGKYITFEGKTTSSIETWTISVDDNVYQYDTKDEYQKDIQILIQ